MTPPTRAVFVLLATVAAVLDAACGSAYESRTATTTTPPTLTVTATIVSGTPAPTPSTSYSFAPTPPTWSSVNISVSFISPTHGWLGRARQQNGQGQGGEVFATDDGGGSWTRQYVGDVTPQLMQFIDADNGWIAGNIVATDSSGSFDTRVLATHDRGTTWTPVRLPGSGEAVAMTFVSAENGWVLSQHGVERRAQLFRTLDGGATWQPLPFPAGATGPGSLQRFDVQTAWVVTKNHIFATRDGGVTWTTAENPCNALQPGWGVFYSGPASFVDEHVGWIGCNFPWNMAATPIAGGLSAGALYRTGDGGATWQLMAFTQEGNKSLPGGVGTFPAGVVALDFLNEKDAWFACGCPAMGVWRTTNGGNHWESVDTVSYGGVEHIFFSDAMDGWAWNSAVLLRTTDGGSHWVKVETPP